MALISIGKRSSSLKNKKQTPSGALLRGDIFFWKVEAVLYEYLTFALSLYQYVNTHFILIWAFC
jgi:hypothetical protein